MAQSRNFFDDVRKELECSVCQEQFSEVKEPKILKCLHTFCKTCLEAWLRQQREGELSCPTCRQITECSKNNIQCLPSNLFYKQMVEIVEAYDAQEQEDSTYCGSCDEKKSLKFYCSDCNCFLCEDCAGVHIKIKVLKRHHFKEIGNFVSSDMQDYARKTNVCKKHKDELRFYCHKCNICICRDCAMLEHRDHDFISFDQALDDKKSEIGNKMQEVEENCSRLRNRKESLEKQRERMNNSIDQAANEVHRGAELCINLIRQREATMTADLLKQKASLQDSFLAQMTALDKKLVEIDSSLEFGKDVIERNNLPEIINVEEILEERFKELSSLPDEYRVKLNCSEVKYVPSDMSALIENALGKFGYTNTEASLSIAQDRGLTEGRLGEDSTFTIITKDSQGQTTYSQIDEVNVDIRSLQTGRITKPSITDTKDGRYKVTYKPETAGEFSVSITAAGEAIMGSPFQLRVEEHRPEFKAVFSTLGASGRLGPTSLGSHYNGQNHDGQVTVVSGIQRWTVPYTGDYKIEAIGAAGGYDIWKNSRQYRGRGARMIGTFHLSKRETIQILVGQEGGSISSGGGGGTFVVRGNDTPLIIAGGGGGIIAAQSRRTECDASTGTPEGAGHGAQTDKGECSGGGGGGFYSNGISGEKFGGTIVNGGEGGKGFLQGGVGGRAKYNNADGGFGGGGGAYGSGGGGGGGGGYSGGSSGENLDDSCGGGGGSYNTGKYQQNECSYNTDGHGQVTITLI